MFCKKENAQGALEYLLMIGAAIIIVAVVIVALSGIIVDTKDQNVTTDYNAQMEILSDLKKEEKEIPIIKSFLVEGIKGNIEGRNITVNLPSNLELDLFELDPVIDFRGTSVLPTGPQDFRNPVTYTVIGKDGTSAVYKVTITKQLNQLSSDKSILSFSFDSISAVGVINESSKTISIEVPFGTIINSISPSIQVSSNATISPLPEDFQDFTNPVIYKVTAEDNSFQEYTVNVNVLDDLREYILISDCIGLQNMDNNLNANYQLEKDINCASISNFIPIGGCFNGFKGNFNGNNKIIYNLTINALETQCVGLFGSLEGNVYNLGIVNASVDGLSHVGILAGYMKGSVSNCYSTGTVHGWIATGGLVAESFGPVSNSYSTATVSGSSFATGGLIGYMYVSQASISNSYATGNVSGTEQIGGLVGAFNGTISDSYATGNVSGNKQIGGLVGIQSKETVISNSYSIGTVSGNSELGGLIGQQVPYGTKSIIESYWDINTSKQISSVGGIGLSTSDMKNPNKFTDWNSFVWELVQGSYPNLVLFNDNPVWVDPTPPIPSLDWATTYPAKNIADATAACAELGGRIPRIMEYCNTLNYHPNLFENNIYIYWSSDNQMVGIDTIQRYCVGNYPDPSRALHYKCIPQE